MLTIVRFVGLAAAVIAPLCFIHHQDAMDLVFLSWAGVLVAILAGLGANPALGAMMAQVAWLGPAVVRAEIAVLGWIGLHFAVDREMRRRGQRQLTSTAIVAFDIEPSAEIAPGAEVS